MLKVLLSSSMLLVASAACAQTATVKVPLCLQVQGTVKQYIPCTGVVPVDTDTGDALSWYDILGSVNNGGAGGGGIIVNAGVASSKASPVQNSDGSKIATNDQLVNAVDQLNTLSTKLSTLITATGKPLQSDGKLPGFLSTPTVNIGSMPAQTLSLPDGLASETTLASVVTKLNAVIVALQGTLTVTAPTGSATAVKQDTLNTAVGAPTDAAATTTDATATSLIAQAKQIVQKLTILTSANGTPYQAGGALPLPSGAATEASLANIVTKLNSVISTLQGTLNTSTSITSIVLPTGASTSGKQDTLNSAIGSPIDLAATTTNGTGTSLIAQTKQLVNKVQELNTDLGTPFQAGGSIGNTSFGATQSGTWNVGITGPVTLSNSGIGLTGSAGTSLKQGSGAATADSLNVVIGAQNAPLNVTATLASGSTTAVTNTGTFVVQNTAPIASGSNTIGSIGNSSFGISGNLPAFAATPTFNIGTAPTISVSNLATVSTSAPTYTNGSVAALSLTPSGALRVDTGSGAGTITANIGTTGGLALDTTLGGLFKAGQSIGNTSFGATQSGTWNVGLNAGTNAIGSITNSSFGISGNLPAFAATPTFNLGTLNGAATAAGVTEVKTALGSPFQAGGAIANTNFGAKLQDSTGAAFGTSGNPIYVSGTGGGSSTPTGAAGTPNASVVSVQGISGGTPQAVSGTITANLGTLNGAATAAKQDTLVTTLGTPFQAGGSIGNAFFGARLQDATGSALGTSANPIYTTGGAGGSSTPTGSAGSPTSAVVTVQGISGGTPQTFVGTGTLAVQNTAAIPAGTNAIGSITNTAFGISGTLPAYASTPTFNLGTAPTLTTNTQAAVTTAAPSYTTGTNAALSLTTGGALRVDTGTAAKTVTGTVTANIGTTNGLSLDTTTNSLFKAGQSIGNTSFGISGTLPAFASTPTVNVGTLPSVTVGSSALPTGAATSALQSTMTTAIGAPTDSAATTTDTTATSLIAQTKQLVTKVNSLITALGTPVQAGTALSNVVPGTAVDRGALVGTTASTIMAANANRKGLSFQIQSETSACYINGQATATLDFHSLKIAATGYFEPDHRVGTGAISIICTEASTPVYAREW